MRRILTPAQDANARQNRHDPFSSDVCRLRTQVILGTESRA